MFLAHGEHELVFFKNSGFILWNKTYKHYSNASYRLSSKTRKTLKMMDNAMFTLMINNCHWEWMCRNTFPCLLQTGRSTNSESGGSRTFLHGSQLTGGKSQAAMQENSKWALCQEKHSFLLVEQVCILCVFFWSVEHKIFWQRVQWY